MLMRYVHECYEEMLAGNADASYPDADSDVTLNKCYANTDADLCIKIMSLCCIGEGLQKLFLCSMFMAIEL